MSGSTAPSAAQQATDLFAELDAIGAAAPPGGSFDPVALTRIAEAGLTGLSVPKEVGGNELPLLEVIDVWSELARADGSIGWVAFAIDSALSYFGAYLPDEGVADLFGAGLPMLAGQFAPNGAGTQDGDTWVVDGSYQFGSGLTVANLAGCGFFSTPADGGDAGYRFGVLPVDQAQIQGNWNVLGLQATQSVDYTLSGVRIPDRHTFDFFAPVRYRGSAMHHFGVLPLTAVGHAAWALGVTRRVLDELQAAASRTRMGAPSSIADSDHGLITIARLESKYAAGRAWVRETTEQAEAECEESGDFLSAATSNLVRQACVHVNQTGVDIAEEAYRLAGTVALRDGGLQRAFRDLHAGGQHFFASNAASIDWARTLLEPPAPLEQGN
jgi:alkylation response protein AidB-like acyl-CoA dehydrogenase